MNFFKNNRGFSLIGMLAASAIGVLVAMGMTKLQISQSQTIQNLKKEFDHLIFKKDLKDYFDGTCQEKLTHTIGATGLQKLLEGQSIKVDGNLKDESNNIYAQKDITDNEFKRAFNLGENTFYQLDCSSGGGGGLCDCSSHDFDRNGPCIKQWELNLHTSSVVNGIPSYIKAFRIPFRITYESSSNFYCGSSSSPSSSATYVYAFHSQTDSIPSCPTGFDSLWTGYSFFSDDLSGPSSCLEKFKPINHMSCRSETYSSTCGPDDSETCTKLHYPSCGYPVVLDLAGYASSFITIPNNWLYNTNLSLRGGGVLRSINSSKISRCRVCEGNKLLLVKHSQTRIVPMAPAGWSKLWEGYSMSGRKGFAKLSNIGSCLKKFRMIPYISCAKNRRRRTECTYGIRGVSWLKSDRGGRSHESNTSRCAVFMKD